MGGYSPSQNQAYGQSQNQNQMQYQNSQPSQPSNSYSNPSYSYTDQQLPTSCPCQNGGLCVQLPSGTIGCSCRYGFTGDRCEKSER